MKLEPAALFVNLGEKTILDQVEAIFHDAFLETSSGPVLLLLERCHELVSSDCDNDILIYSLATWISHFSANLSDRFRPLLVCTTSCCLETSSGLADLHRIWKTLDLHFSIPTEFTWAQRKHLLQYFRKDISTEALQVAASHSAKLLACDLYYLACQVCALGDQNRDRDQNQNQNQKEQAMEKIRDMARSLKANSLQHSSAHQSSIEPVQWDEIHGQMRAKHELQQATSFLTDPLQRKNYKDRGITAPRGLLLHGPPGTGKTLLARAVATASQAYFLPVSIPSIVNAPIGESEKAVKSVFVQASQLQPSVVFFDEIDALVASANDGDLSSITEKISSQLIEEFDNLSPDSSLLVIGATNLLQHVHPSLRQFGRFEREIFVGPLSVEEQVAMITAELSRVGLAADPVALRDKLHTTSTGAQVAQIVEQTKFDLLLLERHSALESKE